MKQQFLKAIAGTIRLSVYDKNIQQIPTAALITLYSTNGNTILQAQTAASINGTTGEMTYVLTASHTANIGVNYKAVWQYTVNGNTYYETQLFDVVLSILSIPITDDDLYKELPALRRTNMMATGTATAGAASSITDTARRKETDDYWKGGTLEIISGTGVSQSRLITSSVQSTGDINVSPAFTTTPDTTSVYRLIKSFTLTIEQCFEKIEQLFYNQGKRDCLILESSQIKVPLIFLTIATIAIDLRDEEGDRWDLIYKDYTKMFEKSFTSLKLDYDEDQSGGVIGQEVQATINDLRILRA